MRMSLAWLTTTSRDRRNSEGSVTSTEHFRASRILCACEEKHLVSFISRAIHPRRLDRAKAIFKRSLIIVALLRSH
jgi:hypothetical protein